MPRLGEGWYDTELSSTVKPRNLFERHGSSVPARPSHRSALRPQHQSGQHLAERPQGALPPAQRRVRRVPRRRRRARSLARPASERLRRRHRRRPRSDSGPVPQLPAHRPALPARARAFRPRHRRGRDVSRGRRRARGRARALRQRPHPARQRLRDDRRGRLAPRLHGQRAVLQHRGLQHLGLHARFRRRSARALCG